MDLHGNKMSHKAIAIVNWPFKLQNMLAFNVRYNNNNIRDDAQM